MHHPAHGCQDKETAYPVQILYKQKHKQQKGHKLDLKRIIIDTMNSTACRLTLLFNPEEIYFTANMSGCQRKLLSKRLFAPHPTSSSRQERGLHPASYCPFHLPVKVLCALCYQSF